MERNIYLENVPLDEALGRWLELCRSEGVSSPCRKNLLKPATRWGWSRRSHFSPGFLRPRSTLRRWTGCREGQEHLWSQRSKPGDASSRSRHRDDRHRRAPAGGFDAVIMIEDLNEVGEGTYDIIKPASRGST